jgi:acyl-CoA dehydrogenase
MAVRVDIQTYVYRVDLNHMVTTWPGFCFCPALLTLETSADLFALLQVEYGLMAEQLGRSRIASEACNCAAPDTGNMEVIARYGTADHKAKWLKPLLAGEIRSGFLMTEPDKASSDGSNISLSIRKEGNELVLNGSKWWSSGSGDDRCKIFIVMGLSDPNNQDRYKRQSMVLVPNDVKGLMVHRMLSVYGYDE